jgi:beta-glucosidase/6-phospho-beta-glucosidase/beta-galactosidase
VATLATTAKSAAVGTSDTKPAASVDTPSVSVALTGARRESAPVRPAARSTPWNLLALARRELFGDPPTIAYDAALNSQSASGVVTGNIAATGDALSYVVTQNPQYGRVVIDQGTGQFTYTPVVSTANAYTDSFQLKVADNGFHLLGFLDPNAATATANIAVAVTGTNPGAALQFPDGFRWGVATSAFQTEMGGAAPVDPNTDWYAWTHDPLNQLLGWTKGIPENGPGSYLQYATDAQLASQGVGADTFRIGMEWSRIFPSDTRVVEGVTYSMADVEVSDGVSDSEMQILGTLADHDAVTHYRDVFAALHDNGLEPMVTLVHFTLPIWLHDPQTARITESIGPLIGYTPPTGGGWASDNTEAEFEKYAAYAAYEFGDQVDTWVTINEPVNTMLASYLVLPGQGGFPPGVLRGDLLEKSLINEAEANAAAYRAIHEFDLGPDTQVGVVLNMLPWEPANPASATDQKAAAEFNNFYNRWFPNAVINGQLDANFDNTLTNDPARPDLANTSDFVGVNHYSVATVDSLGGAGAVLALISDIPLLTGLPVPEHAGACPAVQGCTDIGWAIQPSALRDGLDIAASYGKPLWITENGIADASDANRAAYTVRQLAVLQEAIADGIDVKGYIFWSLIDNLEWAKGYAPRFGLYSFDPVTLERTAKPSLAITRQIPRDNGISASLFTTYIKDAPAGRA